MDDTIKAFFIFASVVGAVLFLLNLGAEKQCHAQWDESGMQHRYSFFSGCMIQRKDGTWIPGDAYREVSK